MSIIPTPPIGPPSRFAWRFLKYLLGFGVWFVIGLAPLLGNAHVRFFSAVIDLYPESIRDWLIPVSGLLMGMMGVVVEFAAGQSLVPPAVRRWFRRATIVFTASLFLLIGTYLFTVVHVLTAQRDGSTKRFAYVTGTLSVPADKAPSCTCPPNTPAQECVEGGTSDVAIRACFGPNRVAIATLVLALLYLFVTGAFAAAVGLLLLAQKKSEAAPVAQTSS